MAFVDTLINTLFDGRYRIVRKLGSGGMADVYLAEDEELGRRVAIKILNDRHANDESFVERFRREAKNAAGLSHPNIVSIYDRGEAEGTYYIAMEYLDGRSLKELVVARGPLPIPDAIAATRQVLGALRFASRYSQSFRNESFSRLSGQHQTKPRCNEDFIDRDGLPLRAVVCMRAYKKLPQLYDVSVLVATLDQSESGVQGRFDAQGVSFGNAQKLARHYLDAFRWVR